ncbi:MAG: DUF3332 family protein [Leptonema sp. (in: Bacteria)]|nr:DUF3332 family protein [Leptonema sp. (in: bacteria)]
MNIKKFGFKFVSSVLVALTVVLSMSQCFGGFGVTRALYTLNKSVMSNDQAFAGKFVRSIVMILMVVCFIYAIGAVLDVLVSNLVEFWTGKPLIANTDNSDSKVSFEMVNDNEMKINLKDAAISSLHVFRDKPGEFFIKEGSIYLPIIMPEDLTSFDVTGKTTLSCERQEAAFVCAEKSNDQAMIQSEIKKADYYRYQYRSRLALGIGTETATR